MALEYVLDSLASDQRGAASAPDAAFFDVVASHAPTGHGIGTPIGAWGPNPRIWLG